MLQRIRLEFALRLFVQRCLAKEPCLRKSEEPCLGKTPKPFYTSSDARESDQAPGHYFAVASVNVGLPTLQRLAWPVSPGPHRAIGREGHVESGRPRRRLLRSGRLLSRPWWK